MYPHRPTLLAVAEAVRPVLTGADPDNPSAAPRSFGRLPVRIGPGRRIARPRGFSGPLLAAEPAG